MYEYTYTQHDLKYNIHIYQYIKAYWYFFEVKNIIIHITTTRLEYIYVEIEKIRHIDNISRS